MTGRMSTRWQVQPLLAPAVLLQRKRRNTAPRQKERISNNCRSMSCEESCKLHNHDQTIQ